MRDPQNIELNRYCIDHSTQPDEVLLEIERRAHLQTVTPQMISGRYQGKLIEFIASMLRPKRALEVGAFVGYSTVCIARGLHSEGRLLSIEVNREMESHIRRSVEKAGVSDRVDVRIGDALEIIPGLEGGYDMIFIDAGKRDNEAYYDMCIPLLNRNGILLLDNVLWGGKVVARSADKDTLSIQYLNKTILNDARVEVLMLPLRDGISLIRKK